MTKDLFFESEDLVVETLYGMGVRKVSGNTLLKLSIASCAYLEGSIGFGAMRRKIKRHMKKLYLEVDQNKPMFELVLSAAAG